MTVRAAIRDGFLLENSGWVWGVVGKKKGRAQLYKADCERDRIK